MPRGGDDEQQHITWRECENCALRSEVSGVKGLVNSVQGWLSKVEKKSDDGFDKIGEKLASWDRWRLGMAGTVIALLLTIIADITIRLVHHSPNEADIAKAVLEAMRNGNVHR